MLFDRGPIPKRRVLVVTLPLGKATLSLSGALNAPSKECTECTEHWAYVAGYPRVFDRWTAKGRIGGW